MEKKYPEILINNEMLAEARQLAGAVAVNRTVASPVDTLCGILGEFAFAAYWYGDWRRHFVGRNRGKPDFPEIEIKTSAFPFSKNLHLLVRGEYAAKRKPAFYVQVVLNLPSPEIPEIPPGTPVRICGFATTEQVDRAPKKDFGSKFGGDGGYTCHYIPIHKLQPMAEFETAYTNHLLKNYHCLTFRRNLPATYAGNLTLLEQHPLGVFCSRSLPADLLPEVDRLSKFLCNRSVVLGGGWQSPGEKRLLQTCLPGEISGLIFYLLSPPDQFQLTDALRHRLARGSLLLLSPEPGANRSGERRLELRRQLMLSTLQRFFFLHIRSGGQLDSLCHWAVMRKKEVFLWEITGNVRWQQPGVRTINAENLNVLLNQGQK